MSGVDLALIGAEESRAPFHAVIGGVEWQVPHLADLPIGDQLALDSMDLRAQTFVLRRVGRRVVPGGSEPDGDALAEAFLGLRREGAAAFLGGWLAHAGMKPGESGASLT